MFSHEIKTLLERNNYVIKSDIYRDIITSSPQIDHVKYKPSGNYFEAWTTDNHYWKFGVLPK